MTMLTTVDNPYNPFTEWDDWFNYDARHGYHTPAVLARLVISSDELSEGDQAWAIEQVIDELVERNETGMYRKVVQGST